MNWFRKILNWITGPLATEAAAQGMVQTLFGDTFRGEVKAQVEQAARFLQLGFFPDLNWDDESGFERVKDALEEELAQNRATRTEAAAMTEDFDRYLKEHLKPWQAKVFRYVVMSQEGEAGRLAVLRRMFTLTPPIMDEKRDQIMWNIASEEPVMMQFGEWMRKNIPAAWEVAKHCGLNAPQFGKIVFLGAARGTEEAWDYYLAAIEPEADRLALELELWGIRASKKRRAKYRLI